MICTPERRRPLRPVLVLALAGAALALAPGSAGLAREKNDASALIAAARGDLARGEGIGAEIRLRQALEEGATRTDVAALLGEAYLVQGRPDRARDWLGPAMFSRDTAARGYRALARLEQLEGDLAAAGRAFDRAIALTPRDPAMWVEIGRLRYAGGEHLLALEAADYALELDPNDVRALHFKGQIVRDRAGLVAALPWFEKALAAVPDDLAVLGDYAATLGDMGRARAMLKVTRRMLDLDPRSGRAFYLQAVLAARAGETGLARDLLARAGDGLREAPGGMLLEGVLEMRAGNHVLAQDALERLARRQPANETARLLLARAIFLSGDYRQVVRRFAAEAARPEATPYLLTLVGRSHEALGDRTLAAPLLDRAAFARRPALVAVREAGPLGELLADGAFAEAEDSAERARAADPGFYDSQALAGDVQLALGRGGPALQRYRQAARIRLPENLMLRMAAASLIANRKDDARGLAEAYLRGHPASQGAARLAAQFAAEAGDWHHARRLLEALRQNGAGRDVELLAELSLAQLRCGDAQAATATAREAYRLQRASPVAAQLWGLSLAATGENPAKAAALLDKARRIMGDTPLLAEAREILAARRLG